MTLFQEIAIGAGLKRAKDIFLVVVRGNDQDLDVGLLRFDETSRLDAADFRHGDIHEDHVRRIQLLR
jgi:hypothetical protein